MIKTGAEIFVESLLKENVEVVFGMPGGSLLPIFDKIHGSKLKFILTRHEQGASHMADGFARSTGKVGVCLATSGPGATNIVTGLATAYMDSVPVVAFTGQVATSLIGNDAFQEADTTGITRPVTKHNFLVKDVKDLVTIIRQAFYIAKSGRPGPVLVDIPVDVQRASCEFIWKDIVNIPSYQPVFKGHQGQIKKAIDAINKSKNPVLYIGGGVISSGAEKEIEILAKQADIPVTSTLLAMGAFHGAEKLDLGMLGMHGTYWANKAMQTSDLIICVGARFDDRCTGKVCGFAPNAKIVHIDIDPTSISKIIRVDIPVVGDAKNILTEIIKEVTPRENKKWLAEIDAWKKEEPLIYDKTKGLKPQFILEKISEITKGEAIVTTEVGQHQMWSAQFYKPAKPRNFITSGGLGTMGFGFPAGIGAKVGNPKKDVIVVAGDGSFQMNIQELTTASLYGIDVKIFVLNNQFLGMVRQWQEMFYGKRYSQTCLRKNKNCPAICNSPSDKCPVYVPDFVKLVEAYGGTAQRVTKSKDVENAIKTALAHKGFYLIDFMIDIEENVLPMVPAGANLDEIITRLA
ncbi:MAG: biosynthetic-type acetolactate synthase large subunit [Endomicrobiia bacterium]|nr:biosynthetic-type acetolactate synthase large subunit [Endomicrobiaceae bacterium]MDD3053072.1 biosynthetic-type acetolactate synthase large subunit [Endomicrobiaceae bacterium]MDD3922236.1 biosynthetic-type acetolactate synthase large subunit [Endomicrobiaceae bacterium]MDD5101606.1 biosynthetic-type acetolactate synthase large subunit [Endomicrobiaceae bacterium]